MRISVQVVHCGMIQENAYIICADGRNDCVVVDPGDDFPKLKRAVAGRQVGAVLLTHGHFDHIMAAAPVAELFGAPVYIAAEDAEMLNDPSLNGYGDLMGGREPCWPTIASRPYAASLSACGMDFEILCTPGHSKGSVCLYLREEGILFSGDTLFAGGYGRLDLHGGSSSDMARSLKALFELPGEVRVYPGHGGDTTVGEERKLYRL